MEELIDNYELTVSEKQNVYYIKAYALRKVGDNAGELKTLKKAIEVDPSSSQARQIKQIIKHYFPEES